MMEVTSTYGGVAMTIEPKVPVSQTLSWRRGAL